MALPFTENFTDTNGTDLHTHNASWIQIDGSDPVTIQSNGAHATTSFGGALYSGDTFGKDQSSQFTYKNASTNGVECAALIRATGSGATFNAYCAWVYLVGAHALYLYRCANSVLPNTAIAGPFSGLAANDIVKLWAVGSAIHLSINGSEVSGSPFTDTNIDGTGSQAGFLVGGNAVAAVLDDVIVDGGTGTPVSGVTISSGAALNSPTVAVGALGITGATISSGTVVNIPSISYTQTVLSTTISSGATINAPPLVSGAPTTVLVNDTNWFFSPYNWFKSGSTYAQSNNPGAYFKTVFSGPSVKLNVDVSSLVSLSVQAARYPSFSYSVDGGAYTRRKLTSADTQITLASGLANTTHSLQVFFLTTDYAADYDRWVTPSYVFKVTGLELTTGNSLSAPTILSGRMIVYGDSNTEGQEVLGAGVTVDNMDASIIYAFTLATAAACEVGIIGFSGQGVDDSGSGGVDALTNTWNFYYSGASRLISGLFSPVPNYIVCDHGINGGVAPLDGLINDWRTAASLAHILICVPWNGINASELATEVTQASDTNCFLLDTGVTNYDSLATNHLSAQGHIDYGADLLAIMPFVLQLVAGAAISSGSVVRIPTLAYTLTMPFNGAESQVQRPRVYRPGDPLVGLGKNLIILGVG